jgi:thiamine biosynthesis lipoprotein
MLAIEAGFAAVADIHRLMSFHEAGSDVSRINRAAAGEAVHVDPRTFTVLEQAAALAVESGGIFDITVATQLVARSILPALDARAPDPHASWRDIELAAPNLVTLTRPLWLDLGGIAKGYAVDQAFLAMNPGPDIQCVVNAGGDLRVAGPAAERVLLRAPVTGSAVPVVEIENASLASSEAGDAAIGPHLDGVARRGVEAGRFVSVVAQDCLIADALTKIVLAIGAGAEDLLKRHGATAYLYGGADWETFGAVI